MSDRQQFGRDMWLMIGVLVAAAAIVVGATIIILAGVS